MNRALCVLHPVTWREPFGLVLIESMACGAPVVAFNRGAIPEIIKHGKTGFIAEDTSEMIEYVKRIKEIKRKTCRLYVAEKFNSETMIEEYEKIYTKVLSYTKSEKISEKKPTQFVSN